MKESEKPIGSKITGPIQLKYGLLCLDPNYQMMHQITNIMEINIFFKFPSRRSSIIDIINGG